MKGNKTSNNRQLLIKVLIRLVLAIIVLGLIFFLPAGSIKFWEAWAYMGILFIPMILVLIYLLKNDPELLERRMKMKEKILRDKLPGYREYTQKVKYRLISYIW